MESEQQVRLLSGELLPIRTASIFRKSATANWAGWFERSLRALKGIPSRSESSRTVSIEHYRHEQIRELSHGGTEEADGGAHIQQRKHEMTAGNAGRQQ